MNGKKLKSLLIELEKEKQQILNEIASTGGVVSKPLNEKVDEINKRIIQIKSEQNKSKTKIIMSIFGIVVGVSLFCISLLYLKGFIPGQNVEVIDNGGVRVTISHPRFITIDEPFDINVQIDIQKDTITKVSVKLLRPSNSFRMISGNWTKEYLFSQSSSQKDDQFRIEYTNANIRWIEKFYFFESPKIDLELLGNTNNKFYSKSLLFQINSLQSIIGSIVSAIIGIFAVLLSTIWKKIIDNIVDKILK